MQPIQPFKKREVPKPQKEIEDCEIEIKNTSSGKRIRFRGKCNKEQLSVFAKNNGIDLEE